MFGPRVDVNVLPSSRLEFAADNNLADRPAAAAKKRSSYSSPDRQLIGFPVLLGCRWSALLKDM
jgi:hypothetical protein